MPLATIGLFYATNKKTRAAQESQSAEKGTDISERQEKTFDSEIRELFRLLDSNNDRSISLQDLGKAMLFFGMTPTQQEVNDAMKQLDVNGDGRIEFQEFNTFMQQEMAKISGDNFTQKVEMIRSAFRTFDKDGNGFIDAKELRVAMQKLGETLSDQELDDMMRQADVDGDGQINYEEFVKIWCGFN